MRRVEQKFLQLKPTTQKVLLLLLGGLALGLSSSPKQYFRVLKTIAKDWKTIDRYALHRAIKRLYGSRLIDAQDNPDGTTTLLLTTKGRNIALRYDIENIKIEPMKRWDKKWRVYLFDIPERHKKARDALCRVFKKMGLCQFQKSVFVCPYECQKETDFVIEFFNLRPYVRYMLSEHIDNELHLKQRFNL